MPEDEAPAFLMQDSTLAQCFNSPYLFQHAIISGSSGICLLQKRRSSSCPRYESEKERLKVVRTSLVTVTERRANTVRLNWILEDSFRKFFSQCIQFLLRVSKGLETMFNVFLRYSCIELQQELFGYGLIRLIEEESIHYLRIKELICIIYFDEYC
ncbi:unnamed protein product [Lepeophtheirus salmonis]|uniref:(salmon louse) hypothetical protein n=1 Tax=Lepeophtheirus salmonis TaxID=72036 RepID=A0A7R8H6G0_LEPSM|nr:unnamed protein product [Lepeophtheirus salmonis]CAF2882302.1 unnamed protein product [Lepeophtheirus salmonis]